MWPALANAIGLLALTIALLGPYLIGLARHRGLARRIAGIWHRGCLRMCGVRVEVVGQPARRGVTLYAANHVSYLDIPILGAALDGAFVAKSEVAGWPGLGFLARLNGTVFVRRQKKHAATDSGRLRDRLTAGENLILFPEGTSSDGVQVRPFKSSLFSAIEDRVAGEVSVQPISISYLRYADGQPLSGAVRDRYAWYGEMTLADHLFRVLGLAGVVVEVRYHRPVKADAFADRKQLARHCHRVVVAGVREPSALASPEELPVPVAG